MKLQSHRPVRLLTRIALLLAVTLTVQALRLPSPITGPLVNFMLILSTALVGTAGGVSIGLVTPWAGLLLGIIPPLLAPAIPFIMAGNALYCFLFGIMSGSGRGKSGPVLGVAAGALFKFAVIAGAAARLLSLPSPAVEVLLLPQLLAALLGGIAAIPAACFLRRILPPSGKSGNNEG